MKLWSLFKKALPAKREPITAIESALLNSIDAEPNHWQITEVQDKLMAHNRELGIVIGCGFNTGDIAYCKKYNFGKVFTQVWFEKVSVLHSDRLSAETAVEALIVENQLKKALKL